jgi:integrase
LQDSSQVFRYAVATGKAASNPARDLKDALRRPHARHFPAIIDPKRFGELLRACDDYAATPVVRAALKLAPMLLLRPGELRFAQWSEFDLEGAMWTVPSARMKRELRAKLHGAPHLVPLPKQAVAVLRELHTITGNGPMVFRGERHQGGLPRQAAARSAGGADRSAQVVRRCLGSATYRYSSLILAASPASEASRRPWLTTK